MSTFEAAIPTIMAHEGTDTNFWVDDPDDPGGETVWGWSMLTIQRLGLKPHDLGLPMQTFIGGCLKQVTKATCENLYRKYFWDQYGYVQVNDQTAATKILDAAINMGPGRAATLAQKAINKLGGHVDVDGKLGKNTYSAINGIDSKAFLQAYGDEMTAYYLALIARKPKLAKFQRTWLRRAQWGL